MKPGYSSFGIVRDVLNVNDINLKKYAKKTIYEDTHCFIKFLTATVDRQTNTSRNFVANPIIDDRGGGYKYPIAS